MNVQFNKNSILKLNKLGLKTNVKCNVIYDSSNKEIIANLNSNFDGKGFLKFKSF